MSSHSQIDNSMEEASVCPFLNMARKTDGLKIDDEGNAKRKVLREIMAENGLSHGLVWLLDRLAASQQKKHSHHPEDVINLTSYLNTSPLNHLADIGVVDAKNSRLDVQKTKQAITFLRRTAKSDIVDFSTIAILQLRNFRRDKSHIFELNRHSFPGIFPERELRAIRSLTLKILGATALPLGELSLVLLILGHREPFSRRKILHIRELEDFFLHSKRPDNWKMERCNLLDTIFLAISMFITQAAITLPSRLIRHLAFFCIKQIHALLSCTNHHLRFFLTAPFGRWHSSNLISRKELSDKYQHLSTK